MDTTDANGEKTMSPKPFKVSSNWIDFAHRPGASDGFKPSVELLGLINGRFVSVPANRPDLLTEIESVCEFYVGGSDPDDDPQAKRVYRRIKAYRAALPK